MKKVYEPRCGEVGNEEGLTRSRVQIYHRLLGGTEMSVENPSRVGLDHTESDVAVISAAFCTLHKLYQIFAQAYTRLWSIKSNFITQVTMIPLRQGPPTTTERHYP